MNPLHSLSRIRSYWAQRPELSERQAGGLGACSVGVLASLAALLPAAELLVPVAVLLALALVKPLLRPHGPMRPALSGPLVPGPIYVQDTGTARGRGVFAARDIRAGELIERCPVTVFRAQDTLPHPVAELMFNWTEDHDDAPRRHAIGHGTASLFNHASPSNVRWARNFVANELHFVALSDIARGTELTINYNNGATGVSVPGGYDWFGNKGIEEL